MDTRLKNSRRLGMLIALLTIAAITVGVMALYPWMSGPAKEAAPLISGEMGSAGAYLADVAENYDGGYWSVVCLAEWTMFGAAAVTAFLAFITILIKPLGLAEGKCFSLPFEVLLFILYLGLAVLVQSDGLLPELVWYTAIGQLAEGIQEEFYLSPEGAVLAVHALNVGLWALYVTAVYWFTGSFCSIFVLGPGRWFRERTLTGRLLRWTGRTVRTLCDMAESVDFRERPTRLILKIVAVNFGLLVFLSCFWFFGIVGLTLYSIVLFFLLRHMYDKMREKYGVLLAATEQIAQGDLEVEIQEELGVFEPLKDEIAKIRNGFRRAVEEEVRSRSMKTELITNVSHDLKTPLTAIITYVNLLKKEDLTEEERRSYVEVLDQKSMRLKSLIEDLFEISKANSNNVTLNLMDVDVVSLMKQVRLELDDKIAGSGIDFRWNLPEEKIMLRLDSEKTYRIFENLLVNIVKYGLAGTRAYVEIRETEDDVTVLMRNISAAELTCSGDQLTERFVRGDASRNTEGSGLGLAIASSFTRLQKGQMEVSVEADLFKVKLTWKRQPPAAENTEEDGAAKPET